MRKGIRDKAKKFANIAAKTAMKASPVPIPGVLQEQLGIQDEKMGGLEDRLDKIDRKLNRILKLLKNGNGSLGDN